MYSLRLGASIILAATGPIQLLRQAFAHEHDDIA
jgi:hypothetical protein